MAAIDQQADGDQRRQGVTDHVQPQRFVPAVRQDANSKGKPGMSSQATRPASAQFIRMGTAKVRSSPYSRCGRLHDCRAANHPPAGQDTLGPFPAAGQKRAGQASCSPASSKAATASSVVAKLLGLSVVSPQPPSAF